MRYEYNSATSAVSVILAAALLHLAKGQSTCQESKTLLARNNSYPSVRCQSSTLNMLAFSWDSIYVYDCKLLSTSGSSKRSVTMSGGCLKNGIDANVTFGPVDLDKNAHSVACEYSGSGSCSDSYSLLVYDPGVLQLTSTVRTGSSTQSASVQNSGNSTQSPLTLQPNSATKFNFTCSFTTCGGTHEARYAWFITTDSNTTMSGFSDWSAATSSGDVLDCAFSDLLDLYTTMYQVSGVYPRTSFAAWDASAFLQTAFAGSNVSYASLCQSPMASGVTVTVRVGCVAQFKLFSSISEFQWSNDTAADGVWQTIVFSCPASAGSASNSKVLLSESELIGIIVGVIVAAILVLTVSCVIVRARRRRAHEAVAQDDVHQTNAGAATHNNNNSNNSKKAAAAITA